MTLPFCSYACFFHAWSASQPHPYSTTERERERRRSPAADCRHSSFKKRLQTQGDCGFSTLLPRAALMQGKAMGAVAAFFFNILAASADCSCLHPPDRCFLQDAKLLISCILLLALWRWIVFYSSSLVLACAWMVWIVDISSRHAMLQIEWLAWLKDKLVTPAADRTQNERGTAKYTSKNTSHFDCRQKYMAPSTYTMHDTLLTVHQ
jgi:hypothetical protein